MKLKLISYKTQLESSRHVLLFFSVLPSLAEDNSEMKVSGELRQPYLPS